MSDNEEINKIRSIEYPAVVRDEYKTLTYDKLKQVMEDALYKEDNKALTDLKVPKELPEDFNLDDKIKDGFLYKLTTGDGDKFKMVTVHGAGSIREFIRKFRESGLPDFLFVDDISVTNDDGLYTNTVFYPIRSVIWSDEKTQE